MEELLQRILWHHHLGTIIITNILAIIITIIIIAATNISCTQMRKMFLSSFCNSIIQK